MALISDNIFVYHITHVENLPAIIQAGGLWSDADMQKQKAIHCIIGDADIKKRRLNELHVKCHPTTKVGEYVPFYFCPRSPMLYKIAKNNSGLQYTGGQEQIVHLRVKINSLIEYADKSGLKWAFSTSNAGSCWADFYNSVEHLNKIRWDCVMANQWSDVTSYKMAEFLIHKCVRMEVFDFIGCHSEAICKQVRQICDGSSWTPIVQACPDWYYQ